VRYYKQEIEVKPNSIVYLTGKANQFIDIFASITNEYPSEKSCDWSRNEKIQESKHLLVPNLPKYFYPFNFDASNNLRYIENPLNQNKFKTNNSDQNLHLLFNQEWLDEKVTVYITAKNLKKEDNAFEFLLEIKDESDFLPKELKNKYVDFMTYFKGQFIRY